MADLARGIGASVRVRATLGAVVVVAITLLTGALALVLLQRETLRSGAADAARARAEQVADHVEISGPTQAFTRDEDDDEPEDVVVQIFAGDELVAFSQRGQRLPTADGIFDLAGADHEYVVATSDAELDGTDYTVAVAVSLEDADESAAALVPLLAGGVPLVLLVVGGVTWSVVGRSLAPVERLRREVDAITDDRLDRRVAKPASRDEIYRLANTMNVMLARLDAARNRQRRFVSDASHELRSPIATLRQAGEVAQGYPGALDAAEFADTVVAESLRLQRLVDQMLVLTRADEGRVASAPREVDVDDILLAEAVRMKRERPDLTIETSGVGPARVHGNPVALDQVVRNLCDNALRHTRSHVRLGVAESGGWARITVADNGTGVPDGDRVRIFERFIRLDEARARDDGGSGLGLSIVRDIVVAHGGRVDVDRADDGGALFTVHLPT